jgi:hypothetical protein
MAAAGDYAVDENLTFPIREPFLPEKKKKKSPQFSSNSLEQSKTLLLLEVPLPQLLKPKVSIKSLSLPPHACLDKKINK